MAVISHGPAPEDHYSLVSNELARDPDISLQAKGLYMYLRSHREGWSMSTERIAEALGVSRKTITKYVQELEQFSYLVREQKHVPGGDFGEMKYTLYSSALGKKGANAKRAHAPISARAESTQHKKTNSFKKTSSLKKTKNTPLDEDWEPTSDQWGKLKEKHKDIDIDSELSKFRDWHIEKGSDYKDWNRAFDNWLKKARPSKPKQKLFDVDYEEMYRRMEEAPF